MKYCRQGGAEMHDDAVVCVKCGCSVTEVDNSISVGLVILAVLIPLFGIIYWVVKAKDRPRCAKACGIAALISWGVGILLSVVISAGMSAAMAGGMMDAMAGNGAMYY